MVFLFVLFMLHWAYFLLVLVGGTIIVGIAVLDQFLTSRTLTSSISATIRAHQFAEDGLRNADLLEGIGISSTFVTRWRDQWVESLRLSLQSSDKDSILTGFSRGVRQFIQVALLGTGALLVLKFHASGGVMIAASIIGGRALAPIETMVSTWKSVTAARLAADRVREIMRRAPKRDEGMPLPAPTGRINVERVSYAPPGGKKAIVAGVSFALDAGDSCGVIGPSASGKSSLMRLMVGAWPCLQGNVRLDGADIYGWPRAELSPYIGYLPQDVELFGGSVRYNIARLTEGDPESVVAAAKLAGAHEMILQLQNGYDTDIGESGAKLSGGQRQRLGIARALYGEPRLVVLDEPNSNLDAAGEEALLHHAHRDSKRRKVTVIIVAASPLADPGRGRDKMLAMRDGQVEAFGPRNDVIQKYTPRGPAPRGRPSFPSAQRRKPSVPGRIRPDERASRASAACGQRWR